MSTFANAIVAHLIADTVFQNDWMARKKTNILSKAAWVHGIIHFLLLLFVFDVAIATAIAVTHVIIDTRYPANWWQRVFKQTTKGEWNLIVSVLLDQTFHIVVIWSFVHLSQI